MLSYSDDFAFDDFKIIDPPNTSVLEKKEIILESLNENEIKQSEKPEQNCQEGEEEKVNHDAEKM